MLDTARKSTISKAAGRVNRPSASSGPPMSCVKEHFGERDPIAPLEHAGALRAAQGAQVEIQVYLAGHGFNCDETANFDSASARLALRRSLDFLHTHVG